MFWAMTMITIGSHEEAGSDAGCATKLPMSLGGVVVGACVVAVVFGSSGHCVRIGRRPGPHHGRGQVPNTLRDTVLPQVSPPGPKSRAKVVTWLHHRWAHIAFIMINLIGPARAGPWGCEGWSTASRWIESLSGEASWVKVNFWIPAATRAQNGPSFGHNHGHGPLVWWHTFGGTWYRGRFLSAKQLGIDRSDEANKIRETRTEMSRAQSSAPRLRIATWNCGSLGNKYQEVLYWLKSEYREGRPVDILAVQETGWKMDMEYKTAQDDRLDPQWFVINSGSGSTEGGFSSSSPPNW